MEEMVKKVLIMLLGGGLVVGLSLPALAAAPARPTFSLANRYWSILTLTSSQEAVPIRLMSGAGVCCL